MEDAACCFTEKTETWVEAPADIRWERYVKTADSEPFGDVVLGGSVDTPPCRG